MYREISFALSGSLRYTSAKARLKSSGVPRSKLPGEAIQALTESSSICAGPDAPAVQLAASGEEVSNSHGVKTVSASRLSRSVSVGSARFNGTVATHAA